MPRHAVRSVFIGGTARAGLTGSEWYIANLAKLLGYVLKGTDEPTGQGLGLDAYGEGGGIIASELQLAKT